MLAYSSILPPNLAGVNATSFTTDWQYQLLCSWVSQQKITGEQAAQVIDSIISEVLFDVAQAMRVVHQINQAPDSSLSAPPVLIDVQQAIAKVQQLWQAWQDAQLANYFPNSVPVIKQPEELRKRTSTQVYQTLIQVLNGQYTLHDLALKMKRNVVQVSDSLLPYIHLGLVELVSIPDLPNPIHTPGLKTPSTLADSTKQLVACVDDSPLVCQTMEALITAAGYHFVGVDDGLRAFAVLLSRKPDLIFLDLVMPNTNGYEICSKLRKIPAFRNTPILILTGNDGIVDRVRAKLVGASDFLSKPVDAGTVLSVIRKHLAQSVTSY
jgi:chemotaxis family two-component system response regulator PixG